MTRAALVLLAVLLSGCSAASAGSGPSRPSAPPSIASSPATTAAPDTTAAASPVTPVATAPVTAASATPSGTPSATRRARSTTAKAAKPVIVIDPGHSPAIHAIDKATGLDVSDYANEPEMRDVFAVAQLVRTQLIEDGYRVVMTKTSVDSRVSLGRRAAIANEVHAALAISIHDQAGASGGIGYRAGNNIVYYQSVNKYRSTPSGDKIVFTNRAVAAESERYAKIFRSVRAATEHASVGLQGDIGYDMASRGLPAGNMWLVQLLSKVPWIYNEVGGNSAGRLGLSAADERNYATALVRSIEKCVPTSA